MNANDNRWYHFNDSLVSPVDEEVVARSEAYLLFYEQRATTTFSEKNDVTVVNHPVEPENNKLI